MRYRELLINMPKPLYDELEELADRWKADPKDLAVGLIAQVLAKYRDQQARDTAGAPLIARF